ncbi:MAG TPA: zf-HC2 domain-containing protein [Thermoanaerobaculia bacterium]|jgi:hypothetical protein|nr:zf-HC2 domain-containing protein [Thermoanaerobaculia bacterium]
MDHTGFPSDETLAAFIDGRLDAETRTKVIAHMTTCGECYSVFLSATEMPPHAAPRDAWRPRRAWMAVATATAAAGIACMFLVTPVRDFVLHRESGMEALAKAAPAQRTIAGRISGFPYQSRASVMRGGNVDPLQNPANASLLTAAAGVQRSVAARRTAANLHASGVANLLLGRNDVAVDTLHEALLAETGQRTVASAIGESDDVALLNDLSAALSNRATATRRPIPDAVEAVRCADRAWRIGHTPEAAWNRAVAVEALNGRARAMTAWHDYLALDATSEWAAEARKGLAD